MTGRANAHRSLAGHTAEELEKVVVGANLHLGTSALKIIGIIGIIPEKIGIIGTTEEDMTLAHAVACAGADVRSGGSTRFTQKQ